MFAGWKIVNDLDSLVELENGIIEFDFINKIQKVNNEVSKTSFNIFYEILYWFVNDLEKHNIETRFIKDAKLKVEFRVSFFSGKESSRTKNIIKLFLSLNSIILTDEKKYTSKKEDTQQFHHIGLKQ